MNTAGKLMLISLLLLVLSCGKYLDTEPADFITPQQYYRNELDLTAALMAVYSELGNTNEGTYSRFLSLEAPAANDEYLRRGSNIATLSEAYNSSASDPRFFNCWTTLYSGIQRANLLLENIDRADASARLKDQIRGEALFLRAYYYFVLVSYWGDVPLKLQPTYSLAEVNVPKTAASVIYSQIIQDMTLAEGLVESITLIGNPGRVSKTAVAGVLARVCLHAAGRLRNPAYYEDARKWALKVIESGIHHLNPDYNQVFINHSADLYDLAESIWEVEFSRDNRSSNDEYERFGSTIGIRNSDDKTGFMQGNYTATAYLFDLYQPGDTRRDWNIAPFYYPDFDRNNAAVTYPGSYKWGRYVAKWRREYQTKEYNKNFGGTNWPLLRYADVLLMFAEADNEVNNGPSAAAYEAINTVRRRAYNFPTGQPNSISDLPAGLDRKSFFQWVKDERARELAFEGLRKLDLLRWGVLPETMEMMVRLVNETAPSISNNALGYSGRAGTLRPYQNFSKRDTLFPIPTQELSLNTAISQNSGW